MTPNMSRGPVTPAASAACKQCPWRLSNQGTRHPDGWYTKANLRRLWSKLRRGDSMTCHPTDPANPIPEGARPVPEGTTTRECTGALVLQQREFMVVQAHLTADPPGGLGNYRRERPSGLTKIGAVAVMEEAVFGGPRPNLGDPDIGYEPLAWPHPMVPPS